ncbi:signal recognition particle receptor subunit beta [Anaeramoeba flamelloides]|uniref:Signal recognition particle receptor subunit beta n=1 Tax=Anaeramoeba flamelloides TaxID=1746091 RepID=A0AAV7YAW3_9EUKA|nr:signal recognition particle receptor subunit beta [Anaeramoeba flamelloides]
MSTKETLESILSFLPFSLWVNVSILFAGLLVVCLLIYLIIKLFGRMKKSGEPSILIVGSMNTGKSCLFYQLNEGEFVETQRSMREQEATFAIHEKFVKEKDPKQQAKKYHFIDWPGSPSLRLRLSDFYPVTDKIVFVVDGTELDDDTFELFYKLLSAQKLKEKQTPFLVVLNKSDLVDSPDVKPMEKLFNREIAQLNKTYGSTSYTKEQEDETENAITQLLDESEEFLLEKLQNPITFVKSSIKNGQIDDIINFITN